MKTLVSFPDHRDLLFESIGKLPFSGSLKGNILHVCDIIDDTTLAYIFKKFNKPKYVFVDSSTYISTLDVDIYAVDVWLESELVNWEKEKLIVFDNVRTTHAANFQINKKQINRHLAIKFCEIFNVDANYTWNGIKKSFDLSNIVEEKKHLTDAQINLYWGEILAPIYKFDKKWIKVNDNQVFDHSVINYGVNFKVWNYGLNKIMSDTAVSLITESVQTQLAALFTEKTAFSMLALTFPIWVGGYNMATEWKKKGFDTFDDVIDHSYENMPTLLERCFYAIYLNLEILTNIELASNLRNKHMDRLIKNRDMLTSENLKNYNRKVISTWPTELQQPALESMHRYLKLK